MKYLFVLLISVFLFGCVTKPPVIQYVDKPSFIETPEALLKSCTANKPPDKKVYLTVPVEEREKLLYEYSNSLLASIAICNIQWSELRRWNTEQKNIYEKK